MPDPLDPTPPVAPPAPAPELSSFDEIRAHPKIIESYSEGERKVILDNKASWDDEEKFAFAPIEFQSQQSAIETEGQTPTPPVTPPVAPETPAPAVVTPPAEPTPFTFKSKEDMDAYIQKQIDARAPAAPEAPATPTPPAAPEGPQKFFVDDWKPKDANELADAMIKNPVFAEALKNTLAPQIIEEYQNMNNQQRVAVREFNQKMDDQYTAIAAKDGLPALSTPEGAEVNKKIATIALKFGKDNYDDAYELYSMIPEDKGGGYKIETPPAPDPKKETLKVQKQAAALVGGGSNGGGNEGGAPKAGDPADWKNLHNTKSSELLAQRMAR